MTILHERAIQMFQALEANIIQHGPKTLQEEKLRTKCITHYAPSFIAHPQVQALVERDFNAKNYRRFDPSCGDDGCQSRPLILQQILRENPGKPYADLPAEDQLFLTLCHMLTYYLSDVVDKFGVLLYEHHATSGIEKPYEVKSNRPKIHRQEVAWMLSYCLAHQSVSRLRSLSEHYADRIPVLNQFFQRQFMHRRLPQLSTQESTQLLFADAMLTQSPVLVNVKIIRKDSHDLYTLGGHVQLLYLTDPQPAASLEDMLDASFRVATTEEALEYAQKPVATILCQALLTEKGLDGESIFAQLSRTTSLEEYQAILQKAPLPLLISALSLEDDAGKGRDAGTDGLFPKAKSLCSTMQPTTYYTKNIAAKKHSTPILERTKTPTPFLPVHVVMSTLENEQQKATALEQECAGYQEGVRCVGRYHMGVALDLPSPGGQPSDVLLTTKGLVHSKS